jgi:2-phosphoglycerate kinase
VREPSVIVEGFRLLPHLVKPLVAAPGNAVWLLPTPEVHLAAIEQRGSLWTIAGQTRDPATALRNLLERDRMFTERLYEETRRLDLRVIEVDPSMTEDALDQRVTSAFGL